MNKRVNKQPYVPVSIYVLYDTRYPDEIRYVGKTIRSLDVRLSAHVNEARRNKVRSHKNNWIRSVLANNGKVGVTESDRADTNETANELEIRYIRAFREQGHRLTNTTDGGEGNLGLRHSDITRARIGDKGRGRIPWNKGKQATPEHRAKLSVAHTGKRSTAEARAKMSASRRGKPHPPEHLANLTQAIRLYWVGRHRSDSTRAKISAARRKQPSPMQGKHHSPETIAKISATKRAKQRRQTKEERAQQSVRMREWWAMRKAREALGEINNVDAR